MPARRELPPHRAFTSPSEAAVAASVLLGEGANPTCEWPALFLGWGRRGFPLDTGFGAVEGDAAWPAAGLMVGLGWGAPAASCGSSVWPWLASRHVPRKLCTFCPWHKARLASGFSPEKIPLGVCHLKSLASCCALRI